MKRRIGIIFVLSIVAALLSTAPKYRSALGEIADAYVTESGEIYYLKEEDNGSKTLLHLTSDGTILLEAELPQREDGRLLTAKAVIPDDSGNCYLWMEALQEDGTSAAEYIQILNPDGKEAGRLFYFEESGSEGYKTSVSEGNETSVSEGNETSVSEGNETSVSEGNETSVSEGNETGGIQNCVRYGNELVLFYRPAKTPEQLYLLRYDLTEGTEQEPYQYSLKTEGKTHFEEYIYAGSETVFLITYDGRLLKAANGETQEVKLFSERRNGLQEGKQLPAQMEEPYGIPYHASASDGKLYFTDGKNFRFYEFQPETETLRILYEKNDSIGSGVLFSEVRNVRKQGSRLTAFHSKEYKGIHSYLISTSDTGESLLLEYKQTGIYRGILSFLFHWILSAAVITILYYLVYRLINIRSLMVKLVLLILPLMLSLSLFLSYYLTNSYMKLVEEETYNQLYLAVYAALNNLDSGEYRNIRPPLDINSEKYDKLDDILSVLEYLNQKKTDTSGGMEKELYLTFYSVQGEESYITLDLDTNSRHGGHMRSGILEELTEPSGDYVKWYLTMDQADDKILSDSSGNSEWMYYVETVRNEEGVCGYVEAGVNKKDLMFQINARCRTLSGYVILAVLAVMLVIFLGIGGLMKNLRKLKNGVTAISEGKWGTMVDIVSRDEMQDIGNSFNQMSDQIVRYFQSMEQLGLAYEQFTPKQLLGILDMNNVLEAVPGRYTVKRLSFLSVTLGTLPEQAGFPAFNQWIGIISAEIGSRGGVIESFQGTDLQAIFTGSAEPVFEAAISIQKHIFAIRGDSAGEVQAGIVIQNGEMFFGIVGDETRRSTMLMAEAVGRSFLLQQFADKNRIPVLATAAAVKQLPEENGFLLRGLGRLRLGEGKQEEIYELCDVYDSEIRRARERSGTMFETGIDLYQSREFERARRNFIDVIRMDSTDETAKMYLFLCDQYLAERPAEWEGLIG